MTRNLSVERTCGLLGVSKQAWYEYHRQSFKDAVEEDLIVECVRAIGMDLPGIGGRKLKVNLYKEYRIDIGRDRLFDILERHGLLVRQRKHRTRTTFSGHGLPTYPDMRKGFVPTGINQLWVSDITYIWLRDRFHYLFLITDAYSKKIVGWEVADNMRHENAYHTKRPHLSLGMLTPDEVHRGAVPGAKLWKNRHQKLA